ncbi:MAG: DUF5606 domain-containing protein [Chitinophagaceae bacterium]
MEYGKIIAVTGLSGLFELISSKNDGAIVRSLDDKTTRFVASRVHNFSHLESIEVYTVSDNVNLVEVFQAMEKNTKALPDVKDAKALKAYFQEVFPELDQERVYTSDMKKMVKWFEVLKGNEVAFQLSQAAEDTTAPAEAEATPEVEEPKAEKKAPKKKKAEEPVAAEGEAEAPKKKAPRKKKTEE